MARKPLEITRTEAFLIFMGAGGTGGEDGPRAYRIRQQIKNLPGIRYDAKVQGVAILPDCPDALYLQAKPEDVEACYRFIRNYTFLDFNPARMDALEGFAAKHGLEEQFEKDLERSGLDKEDEDDAGTEETEPEPAEQAA